MLTLLFTLLSATVAGAAAAGAAIAFAMWVAHQIQRRPFVLGTCAAHRLDEDERTVRLPDLIGGSL